MKTPQHLLLSNQIWSDELTEQNPGFFRRQVEGQRPDVLWIGCSDSRVVPEQITRTLPGEMFIHRNIANLVSSDDVNLMSGLQYAVTVLNVRHIVICGHHGCGGLKATLDGPPGGAIGEWLKPAMAVCDNHRSELDMADTGDARLNRLVECNVRDQLIRLARTDIVQTAFADGAALKLHGWVYDMRNGRIKPLTEIDATTDLAALGAPDKVLEPSE